MSPCTCYPITVSNCLNSTGKLQWERDIPQEALDNLMNLASSDFQANLGKIIHDIYLTGHHMFRDMPPGEYRVSHPIIHRDFFGLV